jgi:predicted phage tail protein
LTLVAYPTADYQHGPMPAGVTRWYRARLIDRIGNSGEWTGWVRGQSGTLADDYLNEIAEQFVSADDGKAILSQLETNPEAILQNALANYDTVNQQWAQFGENTAAIIQAQKVAADANSAVAALETDVTAKFAETSAAIQEKMTAYTDASGGSAIYTLKAGVNYGGVNYDAGLSVAVTVNGTTVDTRVAINADQFVMMSGSGDNVYSPFSVVNGQVFLSGGFIQDGTITNAMIGNYIQSTNYVSGTSGWKIDKSGGAEFLSGTFRGSLYASSGNFAFNGTDNVVVINNNGLTVNIPGGGKIVVGRW